MTGQVSDLFLLRGEEYAVAGLSAGEPFDPRAVGLTPSMASTACWRGYQTFLALADGHLVLDALAVNLVEPDDGHRRIAGPPIDGVSPVEPKDGYLLNNLYEGLARRLAYTGGMLLARDFIQERYVHMGFQSPWSYATVLELLFEDGALVAEHDRSERMEVLRAAVDAAGPLLDPRDDAQARALIERSFDRSY